MQVPLVLQPVEAAVNEVLGTVISIDNPELLVALVSVNGALIVSLTVDCESSTIWLSDAAEQPIQPTTNEIIAEPDSIRYWLASLVADRMLNVDVEVYQLLRNPLTVKLMSAPILLPVRLTTREVPEREQLNELIPISTAH